MWKGYRFRMGRWKVGVRGLTGRYILGGVGLADDTGNFYGAAKLLIIELPLAPVLLELVEQLAARDSWLRVAWVPRRRNN